MKKILLIILVSFLVILGFVWISKGSLLARYLSRELGTPVSIKSLSYSPEKVSIVGLNVYNPKGSRTQNALQIDLTRIYCPIGELFRKTTNINQIIMENINLGVELYNTSGTDNNWARILYNNEKRQVHQEDFFIKSLVLKDLSVTLTRSNGNTRTFGPISIELQNISSKTAGKDIETAIMNQIIFEIMKQFNLPELIKQVDPSGVIEKVLPSININPINGNNR